LETISRPTIAYLTGAFTQTLINFAIWSGISKAAREADVNVICLLGNPINSPYGLESQANAVYKLASRRAVQGLLVWGGGIWTYADAEDMEQFYTHFRDFPVVNIGLKHRGLPSIVIESYQGMNQACVHLIEQHHCRRIAFIRGPQRHAEAEVRFQAYRDALRANGLPYDPALVVNGEFIHESGKKAVDLLLDERRVACDAIAAANDLMAIGALEELQARGIEVPRTVKVIGFDDVAESRILKVPLTTVKQPFSDMGSLALKKLLAVIRREPIENDTIIPSILIERQSCGCLDPTLALIAEYTGKALPPGRPADLQSEKKAINEAMLVHLSAEAPLRPADEAGIKVVFDAFLEALAPGNDGIFLFALNRALIAQDNTKEISFFHQMLTVLRQCILPYVRPDRDLLVRSESIWQQGQAFIADYMRRKVHHDIYKKSIQIDLLQEIGQDLNTAFNIEELLSSIARNLSAIGVSTCFLSLYENPAVSLETSRLLLAYRNGRRIPLPTGGILFPSQDIVPAVVFAKQDRYTLIIEPLYFKKEQLGFAVFGESPFEGPVYQLLRSQLSVAIKSALLFQEKEKLLIHLESRARELNTAMEELKNSNRELEQFSYVASHDLKEPLRKMSVFATRLSDQYGGRLDDMGRDYLARMTQAASRMQKLINDLLDYSHLTTNARPFQTIDLARIVKDVLIDIELLIEKEKAVIETAALPVIEAEPLHIRQLFQNLIINSLKFHQPGRPPVVKIYFTPGTLCGRDACRITVEDNGIGIEENHYQMIFNIFERLHARDKYEGTGIGLAVCKKVVEKHHGEITVESAVGQGTKFIVTLPLKQTGGDAITSALP
jgi:signal transduction histidine kinase/DNA-binding LacI/PurR family transcriptional regulator